MPWQPPNITLRWGEYFKPAIEDEEKLVQMVAKARDARLITCRTAVQRLARQFGIDNVDQYVEALEEERVEREEAEAAMVNAMSAMGKNEEREPSAERSRQAGDGGNPGVRASD